MTVNQAHVEAVSRALFALYPAALDCVDDFRDEATVAVETLTPLISAGAALLPAENMALTVALAQLKRGEDPTPNVAAALVFALARITGGTT